MRDYIVIMSDGSFLPEKAVRMAILLAGGFRKDICFLSFANGDDEARQIENRQQSWLKKYSLQAFSIVKTTPANRLHDMLTELEASFLIIETHPDSAFSKLQPILNLCKPLRIPYIFVTPNIEHIALNKALVPMGFLTEEKEKGIFASKLARFCHTAVTLLQAKDYGSRAATSVGQIQTMFGKLGLECNIKQAYKDSFTVQREAALQASCGDADIVLITASREYGLDDIIFGPPERKIIATAKVPVMVINPRPDIYVLCD